MHINPQAAGYSQTQLEALYRTMEERFHALPGVVKVGIASYTPMEDNNRAGASRCRDSRIWTIGASFVKANAEYFDSVGTHVVMGRGIDARRIRRPLPPVAVVNQTFVKKFFKPARIRSGSALVAGAEFAGRLRDRRRGGGHGLHRACDGRIT